MKKTSKKIAMLILLLSFVQAEEQKNIYKPHVFISKPGAWDLLDRDYVADDQMDPICIRLIKVFEQYNTLKNEGASGCLNNVLNDYEEFEDPPWGEPEDHSKHKELLYELQKLRLQGEVYYFTKRLPTSRAESGYRERLPYDWEIAEFYSKRISRKPQLQFWDVEIVTPRDKENSSYKMTIVRYTELDNTFKPHTYACEGYPEVTDPNKMSAWYYFVNQERTAPIDTRGEIFFRKPSQGMGGRFFLYKSFLFHTTLNMYGEFYPGELFGENIIMAGEKTGEDNRFSCKIKYVQDQ